MDLLKSSISVMNEYFRISYWHSRLDQLRFSTEELLRLSDYLD